MSDQSSSEELLEIASQLFNELNELQGELYDELKVINKELEWSTFYPYGASGIKLNFTWFADTVCDCDKSRQPNKNKIGGMIADPRNEDDYFKFIEKYNLQPEYYVVVADEMNNGSIILNTFHISEILEYILSNAELDGTVDNDSDEITKYEIQKKIAYYVGAINYLGKVNLLYNYYYENYSDHGSPKAMFTNLFGSQLTNGGGIYDEIAKEQTRLLKTALSNTTSSDIKRNCGIFINEASFCPKELVNEKVKIVQKYEEVYIGIIDVLKNIDSLQFCAAEASAEDVVVAKNGNCNIEVAVESIVNCLGETIDAIESETQPSSQKSTDTTNYGPKEREDKTHDVEEDDKYKKVITALLVIILIFLFVGIGFGSYFIYTKTSSAKDNYHNSYVNSYDNSYSTPYINNPMVQQTN